MLLPTIIATLTLVSSTAQVGPIKRARTPSLSPDASKVAFAYQGDIWVVSSNGGRADRLTVHPAAESMPRFSPDGKWIAFTSTRNGSMDIFVMSSDGGEPKRLTFSSANEYAMGWTPDSKWILYYSNRWGNLEIMKVALDGGEEIRLTSDGMELEFFPSISPDGRKIAYNYGGGPGNWRRTGLTGSSTADIWIADFSSPVSNAINVTNDDRPQLWPMWSPDARTIWHVADGGTPNVWRMDPDGKNRRQITHHTGDRVRYPALSANGNAIAYEYASDIWVLDTRNGRTRKLDILVPGDQRYNRTSRLTLTQGVADFAVSPDMKRMALTVRGDIFMTPEAGGTTRRMANDPGREMMVDWISNDAFVFVRMADNSLGIYVMDVKGGQSPLADGAGNETTPVVSPDRKWVAFHRDYTEICIVPVEGGTPTIVCTGYFQGAMFGSAQFSWSPDSKHLAVARPTERGGTNIYVVEIDSRKETLVARCAKSAGTPMFTRDGKRIVFAANEFANDYDLFVVDLTHDPITFTEDALDNIGKQEEKKEEGFRIDEEGIFQRMRRLTSTGGVTSYASSADGKTLFFNQGGQIHRVAATGGQATAITSGAPKNGVWLAPNGQALYTLEAGRVAQLPIAGGNTTPRTFTAEFYIDQYDEAKALFDEIFWVMDQMYYDPAHQGHDWRKIRNYYSSLLPYAYDRAEFYDLMLEMVNELNSSHLGVSGPTQQPQTGDDATGIVGAEPDWRHLESTGEYRIARVMKGSPADHPDSKLHRGDVVIAIDGIRLSKSDTFDSLMNHKAGRKVVLQVRNASGTREVAIKPVPLSAFADLQYENFVLEMRELTDRYSNGKLAYVHIRGMSMTYHEQFMREIRTLTQNKVGLIIDVRYNGGGNTAHLALSLLIKQPWLIRTVRGWEGVAMSENIFRGDTVELPSALMINASSASNAEIMAEGFRRLNIGPVVGVATPGAVIGTGGWTLFDGGNLRIPFAGAYTVDGENLEGNGRQPSIPVAYDPNARMRGEDPMLRAAVDSLLE